MDRILVFVSSFSKPNCWRFILTEAKKYSATFVYTSNKDIVRSDKILHLLLRRYDPQNKLNIRIICENTRDILAFAQRNMADQISNPQFCAKIHINFIYNGNRKWDAESFTKYVKGEYPDRPISANFYSKAREQHYKQLLLSII